MAPPSATAVTSICRNPLQSGQRPVLVALLSANSPIAPTCTISSSRIRKHISSTTPRRSASTASSSRSIHSSSTNRTASALLTPDPAASSTAEMPAAKAPAPLSVLPLTAVLRSLATTTVSSSRLLLPPSLAAMSVLANTESPLLNPDRNPLLRAFMKRTFYAQFCAGEDPAEVRRTIDGLKRMGFSGVILGYAKEVVLSEEQRKDLASSQTGEAAEDCVRNEITPWAAGTMETVKLAQPGDFVALKFTGAGRQALYNLAERLPPSKALADAIDSICTLAASRGIRLLFDAEQHALQAGIDDWTLEYMRRFNTADRATIYGTYQAYLKHAPAVVSEHLRIARDEGFTLGVKLVRGAYLGSDPRQIIHDTKADTDACYDGITEALLRREWNAPLTRPADGNGVFPNVNMVLASHNADSVKKARALLESGLRGTEVAFAQLQGMADEVSCELVATASNGAGFAETSAGEARAQTTGVGAVEPLGRPQAYKYLVWGSTGDCMKYLLRRAYENRDAVQRTRDSRDAMRAELWRRLKGVFGLGA